MGRENAAGERVFLLLCVEELVWRNPCLSEDCAERTLRHISWVIGNSGVPTCGGGEPDLVAPGGLTIELKSEGFKPLDDLTVAEFS